MDVEPETFDFEYASFKIYDKETQTAYISMDDSIRSGDILHNIHMLFDEHSNLVLVGNEVEKESQWYYDPDVSSRGEYLRAKRFYKDFKHLVDDEDIVDDVYVSGFLFWKKRTPYKRICHYKTILVDTGKQVKYTFKNYTIRQFEDMT